jgi:integrase
VRIVGRLKSRQVFTAKPREGTRGVVVADGGNLYVQATVGPAGNIRRSWVFIYDRRGKRTALGLGPIHTISLKRAREKARELREQLIDGIDPHAEKRRKRQALLAEKTKSITFGEVMEMYLASHGDKWRSAIHANQWRSSMKRYALRQLGDMAVADIDTPTVVRVLEPIWKEKAATASRVRNRIESVLGFATVREFRKGDNPARWKDHLSELFPPPPAAKHFAAIPYAELPAFLADVRQRDTIVARALEFLVLTLAPRSHQVFDAPWHEIDLEEGIWTVPPERMKREREHVIPLCDRARKILAAMPRDGERVFPIGHNAMYELLRGLRPGFTVHGLRSSFYDWATERTGTADIVIKMALSHAVGDKTERAYRRGQLFEKRRRLAQQWQDFLDKPTASAGATPMRKGDAHA